MTLRIGEANVKVTLPPHVASSILHVLLPQADMLGLLEWGNQRNAILRRSGSLHKGPFLRRPKVKPVEGEWTWARPHLGLGGPIGARSDRFELIGCRPHILVGPGRVEGTSVAGRPRRGFLPASVAVVTRWRDRESGRMLVAIDAHLTANVDDAPMGSPTGRYRTDLPLRVARHEKERKALDRLVKKHRAKGHRGVVLCDSNFHHMPVWSLTGWWECVGYGTEGTEGWRAIDLVSASWGAPDSVKVIASRSDHKHPIATWD